MDRVTDSLYYLIMVDLDFLHCSYIPRCSVFLDKYFDGYCSLQYMTEGAVELGYDGPSGVLRRLEGKWFWPAYPGPRIVFHPAEGSQSWSHRYVAFRGPRAERWMAEGLFPLAGQPAPSGHDWTGRFDRLLSSVRGGERWDALRAANDLERLLLDLADARASDDPSVPTWLTNVRRRLEEGISGKLDYGQLAAEFGMAESTLRRRFREATGTALHTYVLQRRVAMARALLGDTDLPVRAVARELGYRDVYFFSRQFAALVGVPPSTYRRSHQS